MKIEQNEQNINKTNELKTAITGNDKLSPHKNNIHIKSCLTLGVLILVKLLVQNDAVLWVRDDFGLRTEMFPHRSSTIC